MTDPSEEDPMNRNTKAAGAAALLVAGVLTLGTVASTDDPTATIAPSPSASTTAPEVPPLTEEPTIHVPANPPGAVKKILVVVEENHSFRQMWDGMAYLRGLSKRFAYASDSHGNHHPSQPNYVIMAAGSNRGITSNSLKFVTGPSVFGRAFTAGKKAKVTADGMGGDNCRNTDRGAYRDHHNPWIPFKEERALCEKYDKDYARTWTNIVAKGWLGNVHFLIPNNDHNSHDGSLAAADRWLKSALAPVFEGPDWKSGELVIVITADEDDKKSQQHILTTVLHPSLEGSGKVVTKRLDQYSLHESLARVVGVQPLGTRWQSNPDLLNAFGVPAYRAPEEVTP
jgi:hypothetical protein